MKRFTKLMFVALAGYFATPVFAQNQPQPQVDIEKVNTVIAEAIEGAIEDHKDIISSASLKIDAETFNLEKPAARMIADLTAPKTLWTDKESRAYFGFGVDVKNTEVGDFLIGEVGGGVETEVVPFLNFLSTKLLKDAPDQAERSPAEAALVDYLTNVSKAKSVDEVSLLTSKLFDLARESEDKSFEDLKEFLKLVKLNASNGELELQFKNMEIYGIALSGELLVVDQSVYLTVRMVDVKNSLLEKYRQEMIQAIKEYLLTIQNASDEMKSELKGFMSGLLEAFRDLVSE